MKKTNRIAPDWWETTEMSGDDPWSYIVFDFQEALLLMGKLSRQSIKYWSVAIREFPETEVRKEKIQLALSWAVSLAPDVKKKISAKVVNEEFLWHWGEFQKAIAILRTAYPDFVKDKAFSNYGALRKKQLERQWYVLWYDWFSQKKRPSRLKFDAYFEELLRQIVTGVRQSPKIAFEKNIKALIIGLASDPEDLQGFMLSKKFCDRKFYGAEFREVLEIAKENRENLPPVGEENYPRKS